MNEQSAVDTLREIRARFAALQATLEEADRSADDARVELAATKAAGIRDAQLALTYKVELEKERAKTAEWKSLDEDRAEFFRNTIGTVSLEHVVVRWQELVARIAELEAARRWVPVGERLPNRGQTVYGWIHPVSYVPGHGKEMTYMPMLNPDYPWRSTWDMATYSALDITHWQPLPAGPEVE